MSDLSKKFRRALAINTAIALAATGTACGQKSEEYNGRTNQENNEINENIQWNNNHNNPRYFEKDEIFIEYSYLKNKLKNKEDLDREEILRIGDVYKKIISSINYIDYELNEDNDSYVVDEFPKMRDLYTDMQDEIIELMCDNSILKIPNGTMDFQKELIIKNYLMYTEQTPLENVKIAQLEENRYSVLSKDGEFYFDIYIYTEEERSLCISPKTEIQDLKEISSTGISLTDIDNQIPRIDLDELGKEEER